MIYLFSSDGDRLLGLKFKYLIFFVFIFYFYEFIIFVKCRNNLFYFVSVKFYVYFTFFSEFLIYFTDSLMRESDYMRQEFLG